MAKSQVVGTIQYIEWLIIIDLVQPSLIAGVCSTEGGRLRTGTTVVGRRTELSPHIAGAGGRAGCQG